MSPSNTNTEASTREGTEAGENESWSAAEIAGASGELLAHLARSGIRFLPQSDQSAVADWAHSFAVAAEPTAVPNATNNEVTRSATPAPAAESPASVPAPSPTIKPRTGLAQGVTPSGVTSTARPYPGEELPVTERIDQLELLAQRVAGCTRCKALASCRTQTVFGEGAPKPRFVFFGEGPGADEDKAGRPFMDRAGQLLTKMIEAIHLSRDEVYLLNTVKCRAPGNRNPEPDEVANCREYFEAQLNLLRPEYIVCLGTVSSQALLQSKLSIGRLRQRFHQYHDSKVLVIYHPAYLLRNPDAKKAAWADLQMLMKDAGL